MCAAPLAALARAQEEQNNVEWIPKLNAHAQNVCSALLLPSQNLKSVLVSIRHGFAPLETSRGRQEEQHTQFARRMETKVVVATTWLPVGIGDGVHGHGMYVCYSEPTGWWRYCLVIL